LVILSIRCYDLYKESVLIAKKIQHRRERKVTNK